MRQDLAAKANNVRRAGGNPSIGPALIADSAFVDPLLAMFAHSFVWRTGEYRLTFRVRTSKGKVLDGGTYEFTIFESDAEELRKLTDDYKVGAGVYYDNVERRQWVFPIARKNPNA